MPNPEPISIVNKISNFNFCPRFFFGFSIRVGGSAGKGGRGGS